jgi:hypothetical protein
LFDFGDEEETLALSAPPAASTMPAVIGGGDGERDLIVD